MSLMLFPIAIPLAMFAIALGCAAADLAMQGLGSLLKFIFRIK